MGGVGAKDKKASVTLSKARLWRATSKCDGLPCAVPGPSSSFDSARMTCWGCASQCKTLSVTLSESVTSSRRDG